MVTDAIYKSQFVEMVMLVLCLIGVTHVPCNTEINFKTMSFRWNLMVVKLTEYFNIWKE
jgi:hypothetical protein